MKKVIILILFFLLFILYGCNDYQDISRSLYVNSFGIDYNKETKEYTLYYHMTNPIMFSTTELAGSNAEKSYTQTKTTASSIIEAMQIADNNTNQEIRLTHITSYVLSSDFATYENLLLFYQLVTTHEQLFPTPNIFITDSKISELYEVINVDGISPHFSILTDDEPDTTYKMTKFSDFLTAISENKGLISFPIITTKKDIWSIDSENVTSVEIIGKQFVTKEKSLSVYEKDFPGVLYYDAFEDNTCIFNNVSVLFQKYKVNIKISDEKNIKIKITSVGKIQNSFSTEEKNIETIIEQYVNNFINYSKENDLDIYHIKDRLYRFNKLKSGFNLKTTNFNIIVDLRIYR